MPCKLCDVLHTIFSFFWTRQTSHVVYLKIHRRLITARKRSLGQGNMFTGVCLSTGGGVSAPRGVHGPGGCVCYQGDVCSRGVCSRGCMVPGGCLLRGGLVETSWMATAAGGTHPTGMHSCLFLKSSWSKNLNRDVHILHRLFYFEIIDGQHSNS